jgi:hypothetical protein
MGRLTNQAAMVQAIRTVSISFFPVCQSLDRTDVTTRYGTVSIPNGNADRQKKEPESRLFPAQDEG